MGRIRSCRNYFGRSVGGKFPPAAFGANADYNADKAALCEQLRKLSASFDEQSARLEPDFVCLGRSLRSLYEEATGLTKKVNERLTTFHRTLTENQIAGEEGLAKTAIGDLRTRLNTVSEFLKSLDSIARESEKLSLGVAAVDRVGFTLKTTVFGFAMESVRSPDSLAMFSAFNLELRALSEQIAALSESVGIHVSETRRVQEQQITFVSSGLVSLKKMAAQLGNTAERTAAEIQALLNESFATLQQSEEISRAISARANDAVYHLQFGDIIRQKSEHISAALKEATQRLESATTRDDFRSRATDVDHLLAIQISQLELIHEETKTTHNQLRASFAGLSSETDRLVSSLQDWSSDRKGGTRGREALMDDLLRLESLQSESRKLSQQANETAQAAVATSTQLSERLQEITTVNNELHFLALNAVIKTAALGAEGATLEVLSMEVHRLYLESSDGVDLIAGSAATIRTRTGGSAQTDDSVSANLRQESALQTGLSKIKGAYQELDAAAKTLAQTIDGQQTSLAEHLSHLDFLAALAADLEAHREELLSARKSLNAWKHDDDSAPKSRAMDQRYTMESEREIHLKMSQASLPKIENGALAPTEAISSAAASPATLGVDFFDFTSQKAESGPSDPQEIQRADDKENNRTGIAPTAAEPSLGDNVDLF